jgi:choline dehydrogenase-like flavoprotein
VTGNNTSGINPIKPNSSKQPLAGTALLNALHDKVTKQVSLGFLIEQTPDPENRVSLSDKVDGLGLPRPRIQYDFSQYTKAGLAYAVSLARKIFKDLNWNPYNDPLADIDKPPIEDNCSFPFTDVDTKQCITIRYMGAGHIAGTCRMGADNEKDHSVVDSNLRYWSLKNLYIVGSSVFPTLGTANPTLTIAALSIRLGEHLGKEVLVGGSQPGASSI